MSPQFSIQVRYLVCFLYLWLPLFRPYGISHILQRHCLQAFVSPLPHFDLCFMLTWLYTCIFAQWLSHILPKFPYLFLRNTFLVLLFVDNKCWKIIRLLQKPSLTFQSLLYRKSLFQPNSSIISTFLSSLCALPPPGFLWSSLSCLEPSPTSLLLL